jgi:hypothetical protein
MGFLTAFGMTYPVFYRRRGSGGKATTAPSLLYLHCCHSERSEESFLIFAGIVIPSEVRNLYIKPSTVNQPQNFLQPLRIHLVKRSQVFAIDIKDANNFTSLVSERNDNLRF